MIIPIRLDNPLNGAHGHWSTWYHKRRAVHKAVHYAWLEAKLPRKLEQGQRVEITRIGKRTMDGDGLQAACKAVRDAAAAMLGIDDRLDCWAYQQRCGKSYAVEIRILGRDGST